MKRLALLCAALTLCIPSLAFAYPTDVCGCWAAYYNQLRLCPPYGTAGHASCRQQAENCFVVCQEYCEPGRCSTSTTPET